MMSAEAAKTNCETHRVIMEERGRTEVRGVTDVVSFDEQAVLLKTLCGDLSVEGASLHIHVLDLKQGIVSMEGRVDSMVYYESQGADKGQRRGFFARLMR